MLFKNRLKIVVRNLKFFKIQRNFTRGLSTEKEDIIVKSPFYSLDYPKLSIDQYVWQDLDKWMNKTAVVDGLTDKSITYARLRDNCRALAIHLRTTFNLNPGDTIAVCLPNSIEFPIVTLGGSEAELIVTTINPIYLADEIARQLIDSNVKVIFGLASMSSVLKKAVELTKRHIKIVYITQSNDDAIPSDGVKFNELITIKGLNSNSIREGERDCDSTAMLPYSSGTTGLNKGVKLSHMNLVSNCMMISTPETGMSKPALGDYQDVLPCVLPYFHIYGLNCTLISKLAHGCKLVTLPRFTPDTYLNVLEKYQGNILHLVPPIIIFFNNYDKVGPQHTRSIEKVLCGAAPVGGSDIEKFLKIAPKTHFIQAYGLTEASPVTHSGTKSTKSSTSVGYAVHDTETKIVDIEDPEFRGLGPNQQGEILIRGPQIMLGYHNNEKATSETLTSDKWLRTGDIGYYDESHEFFITDRLKELIKVKGFQVAPAELEAILRMHEDVADAAVIGIPHETAGELPRAYVVLRNNSKITEDNIKSFMAEKVASYKRLEGGVEIVQEIPKNATGKILRRELTSPSKKQSF